MEDDSKVPAVEESSKKKEMEMNDLSTTPTNNDNDTTASNNDDDGDTKDAPEASNQDNDNDSNDDDSESDSDDSDSDDSDSPSNNNNNKDGQYQMSAYERQRLERIKRNQEYLASLGLQEQKQEVDLAKRKAAEQRRLKRAQQKAIPLEKRELKSRSTKKNVNYTTMVPTWAKKMRASEAKPRPKLPPNQR